MGNATKTTVGFIGTGHMASAIARRLRGVRILLNNRTAAKAEVLARELEDASRADLETLCRESRFLFLGVKPTDMETVAKAVASLESEAVFVSMAAGLSLSSLSSLFPGRKILRIMPNTPVEVGKGLTFLAHGKDIGRTVIEDFVSLMGPCGETREVEEAAIDAASVLTGSAPAYLDYFLDALAEAGVKLGLSKVEATDYALSMAEGAVALARESGRSPVELGKAVCSPGGSTIEGVGVLLEKGMYDAVGFAAAATYYKNRALGGKYPFHGSLDAMALPVDERFAKVLNPYCLYDILSTLWSADTCAPRMRERWSKANKTLGQCSITAFLVQDIFGGEVYGVPLSDGAFHCFNKVGDKVFDLTSEQFLPGILNYPLDYPQSREVHFSKEEKRLRYEALKAALLKAIS